MQHGSRIARFTDKDAGLRILASLLRHEPQPLKIQRELVDDNKFLLETSAGQVLDEELAKI